MLRCFYPQGTQRILPVLLTMVTCLSLSRSGSAVAQETPDSTEAATADSTDAAIRQSVEAFISAFKQQDASAIAALWTPDGVYVDQSGKEYKGRPAIQDLYQEFFEANDGAEIEVHIESIRRVAPEVAIEQGIAKLTSTSLGAPSASKYVAVHVKQDDGGWLMDSVRDSRVEIPTTYDRLVHLEMLVGTWAAEHNNARVELTSGWNPTKTHLERRFVVTNDGNESTSTEIVAWDPTTQLVTSWTFSDDGALNVGRWKALEDGWVVRNHGATANGIQTSSVDFWTPLLDGALGWRSTQRTAGGAPVSEPNEVVLKKHSSTTND